MRVVITGAAHGIGAASAARLSAMGARIIAVDLAEPPLAEEWLCADLSDPSGIDALMVSGRFDALVNAAGLPPRPGTEAAVLAVNHHGLARLTERVLPLMPPGGGRLSALPQRQVPAGARTSLRCSGLWPCRRARSRISWPSNASIPCAPMICRRKR